MVRHPTSGRDAEDEENDLDSLPHPTARTGEEELLVQEEIAGMKEALHDLPAQQRAALLLARVEGFSYLEVARALGCSVSAVKSLVHRATVTLRDRVGGTARE